MMYKVIIGASVIGVIIVALGAWYVLRGTSPTSSYEGSMARTQSTVTQKNGIAPVSDESYTLAEVASHHTEDDCWFVVDGVVYDVTSFIATGMHKGGMEPVIASCGTEATVAFNAGHAGRHFNQAMQQLQSYTIGSLIES